MSIYILGYGWKVNEKITITEETEEGVTAYGLYNQAGELLPLPIRVDPYSVNYTRLEEVLRLYSVTPSGGYLLGWSAKNKLIHSMESFVEDSTCDSCGNDKKCKLYPLGENGNLILCQRCFSHENNESRKDSRGYTDTNAPFTSWYDSKWYNLNIP